MKPLGPLVAALVVALLAVLAAGGAAQDLAPDAARPWTTTLAPAWGEAELEAAASLPVQSGGRVKPLRTHATYLLQRLHGRRTFVGADGRRLEPTAWFLETFLFPERMAAEPLFLVEDAEAVRALGLDVDAKERRDRYSLDELGPGLSRLFQLAHEYGPLEAAERTTLQQQVVDLATHVKQTHDVMGFLDVVREDHPVGPGERLAALTDGASSLPFHEVLARGPALMGLYQRLTDGPPAQADPDRASVSGLLSSASQRAVATSGLVFVPPRAADDEAWNTPNDLLAHSLRGDVLEPWQIAVAEELRRLARERHDPVARTAALTTLAGHTRARADARGELERVDLEVTYLAVDLLGWSLGAYAVAVLATLGLWLRPRGKRLARLAAAAAWTGTLLLVAAIVWRCVLRSRPPVSTLYETVLFVTASGALIALFVEWVDRRRLALSAAALTGVLGLLLASGYELLDAQDTMPSLVAVLDTNFWLATHVTTITLGYGAGMLAALMASAWILTRAAGWKRAEPAVHRHWARTIYGVLAFSTTASLVGTILGGIWANESWGRFWGWDPKENGALLIVLTQVAILHGRLGGYLRERGLCVATAFGGTVIAFSWWGVNLLGVGLHSYGFTSGVQRALWVYYGVQWGIAGLGALDALRARRRGGDPGQGALKAPPSGSERTRSQGGARSRSLRPFARNRPRATP